MTREQAEVVAKGLTVMFGVTMVAATNPILQNFFSS